MKDGEANVALIRHITRRLDEFLDEHTSDEFETIEELCHVFAQFLWDKDKLEAGAA